MTEEERKHQIRRIANAATSGFHEGLITAARLLEEQIEGCAAPNCSDCQTLRAAAVTIRARARGMEETG